MQWQNDESAPEPSQHSMLAVNWVELNYAKVIRGSI